MTMDEKKMPMISKWFTAICCAAAVAAGCTSAPNRAPVEDRGAGARAPATAVAMPAPVDSAKALPGAENSGKPGYYSVKPGDTLIRIGLENGQHWKDLVRWNALDNPNIIEVGQVLRVVPPGIDPTAAATKPVTSAKVETKPLDARPAPTVASGVGLPPAATSAAAASTSASTSASASMPASGATNPAAQPAAREGDDDVNWAWPANGSVIAPFDDGKAKGLGIGGKAGDPVLAAADGRVVYAGSGLRGYGNLIILKHNNTYLSAYAHNQSLLVKEEQTVRRGQKIAEMGSTDADAVRLHFEIRKQGKPVDPAKLLPLR